MFYGRLFGEGPPLLHSNFFFTKKFIGTENNTNYIKFSDWFKKNSDLKDNILKIDIEGDEYDLLPSITEEEFLKMRIIIFEIHNFSNIINPLGFNLIKLIFDKLQKNHRIVNINVNTISPEIKFSKKKCTCRKPNPEMLNKALKKWKLKKKEVIMIGNKMTDKIQIENRFVGSTFLIIMYLL